MYSKERPTTLSKMERKNASRWALLRKALLASTSAGSKTFSAQSAVTQALYDTSSAAAAGNSVHRHTGFSLLKRKRQSLWRQRIYYRLPEATNERPNLDVGCLSSCLDRIKQLFQEAVAALQAKSTMINNAGEAYIMELVLQASGQASIQVLSQLTADLQTTELLDAESIKVMYQEVGQEDEATVPWSEVVLELRFRNAMIKGTTEAYTEDGYLGVDGNKPTHLPLPSSPTTTAAAQVCPPQPPGGSILLRSPSDAQYRRCDVDLGTYCSSTITTDGYAQSCRGMEGWRNRLTFREKLPGAKVSLRELFSHNFNDGVDNTGNIRTWPTEEVLTHYILRHQEEIFGHKERRKVHSVLEIGAGMCGIAGQAIAAKVLSGSSQSEVVLTDGNVDSVSNLSICVDENRRAGAFGEVAESIGVSVRTERLVWSRDTEKIAEAKARLGGSFDLIIASDCLFFEDFHVDLLHTLQSLLSPPHSSASGGVALLLQPRRGKSMDRFLQLASSSGSTHFAIEVMEQYDEKVWQMHQEFLNDPLYTPDIHYPVLLKLTKR